MNELSTKRESVRFELIRVDHDPFAETPATAPLTEAQREIWTVLQMGAEGAASYQQLLAVRLRGPLEQDALAAAVDQLAARHEALWLQFASDGSVQRATPAAAVDMPVADLTSLTPELREQELQKVLRFESQQRFDMTRPPLMRARLIREEPETHTLLLTAPHIVCDGWSGLLLLRDLGVLYEVERFGLSAELPAAGRFTEFARRTIESNTPETFDYWRAHLDGALPTLELPTDRQRPAIKTFSGAIQRRAVAGDIVGGLRKVSARNGSTLFALLLAAWQVLLYRLSAQTDIVVGVPIVDREGEAEQEMVGHGTNLLPLRARFDAATSFVNHLKQTQRSLLDAQEHRTATFGTLLRLLNVPRVPSRTPLVTVTFNVDKMGSQPLFESLAAELLPAPRSFVNWELEVNIVEHQNELVIECTHNSDLFNEETVRRWLGHYETLLTALVQDPGQTISSLPLLSAGETRQQLEWGERRHDCTDRVPVHRLFEASVARSPEAVAVVCEGQRISYEDLNRRANRLAHRLRELGVGRDVLVGLCATRSVEMIVGILGILKAGGAYLPLDPTYPKDRLTFMVEDANPTVLVTRAETAGVIGLQPGRAVVVIEDMEAEAPGTLSATNPMPVGEPDDLAYVIYTSGSTGTPKGVQVTHRNVARLLSATELWFHFGPDDVWTLFHSYAFDFSVWEIWGALAYGGRLVVVPYEVSRSPEEFLELLRREQVTVLNQTPSAFRQLACAEAAHEDGRDLSLRLVIFGGEALDFQSLRGWVARHGDARPQLVNMYGITETTVHVTYRLVTAADVESGAGSLIGKPIPDLMLRVLDQHGQPVPVGIPGELYVGGAGVARGYLRRQELTSDRFVLLVVEGGRSERFYRSGDLVRLMPNGDLEYLGRIDQQIKIRGFRVELGEIEAALFEQPGVLEAVVVPRDSADGDRRLIAYVAPAELSSEEARDALRTRLPDYMIPSVFVGLPSLPRTQNGKVDRQALPEPEATLHADLPRTPTEEALARVWADVLNLESVPVHADFFDLGGHSLLAIKLATRINQELGYRVPFGRLLQYRSVADLARVLEPRERSDEPHPDCDVIALEPAGSRVPIFFLHGIGAEVWSYLELAKHLGPDQPVYGFQPSREIREDVTVRSLASQYASEIQRIAPNGPYLLGGFCSGALVALEVAQQLESRGGKVALLAAIDYEVDPPATDLSVAERVRDFLINLPVWIAEDLIPAGPSRIMDRLRSKARRARRKIAKRSGRTNGASNGFAALRDELGMWRLPDDQMVAVSRMWRAVQQCKPTPYSGRAVVIRPRAFPIFGRRPAPDLGWGRLVLGGLEVQATRGSHQSMLEHPFVAGLGTALRRAIDRAIESDRRVATLRPSGRARASIGEVA